MPTPGTNPMQSQQPMPQPGIQPGMQPQQPMAQPPNPDEQPQDDSFMMDAIMNGINLADRMRKSDERKGTTKLNDLGDKVVAEYEADEASRDEWLKRNKDWMKLATQVVERKTFPWEGAANVKYPILTTAALQFSARAYPSLIPSFDIVKAKVMGPDPDGKLTDTANTLSTHMSYQILYEMDNWEEDLDRLTFILPIVGVIFKKVYWSERRQKIVSELVQAKDFVVNYYTKDLCKSMRYTHVLYLTPNEIKERQNYKQFLEYDEPFEAGEGVDRSYSENKVTGQDPWTLSDDEDVPRKVLEQYRYIDLDEDDYKEPYIVTVDHQTKQVLRITPNFSIKGIDRDDKGKIKSITPNEVFVKFGFIPNPDSGFYDLGFGLLLGGLNESVNSVTNMLLDSGAINNLQAGFISKGLRLGGNDLKFKVGEWKVVNAVGDDLRKSIVPLPSNAPSQVLFSLLETLVQSGKELSSVADIFTGKMPGQNTPAATTMASIEQGLKVFTSIYKRIYRSMQSEFELIANLNAIFLPTQLTKFVSEVNGEPKQYQVSRFDYQQADVRILPAADPNMVSETQKMMKIQGLHELVPLGTINVQEMTKQALQFQGQENIQALMQTQPPQPPVELQIEQMRIAFQEKELQANMIKTMSDASLSRAQAALALAKAKTEGNQADTQMWELQLEQMQAQQERSMKMFDMMMDGQKHKQDMQMELDKHQQEMKMKAMDHVQTAVQNQQSHVQDMALAEKKAAAIAAQAAKSKQP